KLFTRERRCKLVDECASEDEDQLRRLVDLLGQMPDNSDLDRAAEIVEWCMERLENSDDSVIAARALHTFGEISEAAAAARLLDILVRGDNPSASEALAELRPKEIEEVCQWFCSLGEDKLAKVEIRHFITLFGKYPKL